MLREGIGEAAPRDLGKAGKAVRVPSREPYYEIRRRSSRDSFCPIGNADRIIIMGRQLAWIGLMLTAAAIRADEPPARLPAPRVATKPDRDSLQRELSRLQLERAALQAELGQTDQHVEMTRQAAPAETTRLRLRLAELLLKLGSRDAPRPPVQEVVPTAPLPGKAVPVPPRPADPVVPKPAVMPPSPESDTPPPTGVGKIVDPLALAQALFRAGDYEAALGTYRLLDVAALGTEDSVTAQYMMACCLRKLGRFEEALPLYREVANAKDDAFLAECAQWQLGALSWRRDLEARLQQLRQRREAVEVKP